ncbi:hypothetical protein EV384_5401 [Micromonospora kangleipakensis]|uniref:Uncharacterized protein n=1 Tax=Micromonospora kangleipakensis TaxID=1077942 RepID=A0A4Q8BGZ2_9ACTN|nr:hypothetical protein [Micromonospora kangleipakensis]RZU76725.1 hypothetical protein EV384_5401 [Micromonospora kangleipakensis]
MATTKPTGDPAPSAVALDADLAARLVAALETIGSAITRDEVNDARALSLLAHLTGRDGYGGGPAPDPVRSRAARDYEVLRGLLGRAGAPRGLNMRRSENDIVVDDPLPVSSAYAIVESPGTLSSGPVTERVDADPAANRLSLDRITQAMPISRVEVFDCEDTFLAFGPSLAAFTD